MSFNYADLKVNDLVEVVVEINRDPATGAILMNDVHPGTVFKVYQDGADIVIDSQALGRRLLEWCVHIEDEKCKAIGPCEATFEESKDPDTEAPGTGIFRLSRNQKILIGLEPRLAAQERLMNQLVLRITALESNKPKKASKQARSALDAENMEDVAAGKTVPRGLVPAVAQGLQ